LRKNNLEKKFKMHLIELEKPSLKGWVFDTIDDVGPTAWQFFLLFTRLNRDWNALIARTSLVAHRFFYEEPLCIS
jgi:hypothetical protein